MKKIIAIFIIFCFSYSNLASLRAFSADNYDSSTVFEGHAEKTETKEEQKNPIFTGETEVIKSNDIINMTVSQVLGAGVTETGDEFFAEITNEVVGDKGVILPLGTIAHGKVRDLSASKRLGRDGWIELSFDYLVTPDGREIPIEGKMTTKLHPVAGVAKTVATDTAYTLAGGVIGGFTALNLLGIEAAIASQGYTVAGGAAIGAGIGLGISLVRKGKDVLISPGDEIKVKILDNLKLPVLSSDFMKQEEISYKGLDVRITNVGLEKDPFGELNTIIIGLAIQNHSNKNFSSFDVCLVNDLKTNFYPSIFAENTLAFTPIKIGDRVGGRLAFSVDNPKRKHWLVFYDRQTRKPLAKISVDNAKREIEINKKDKKKRKKRSSENT